MCVRSAVLHPSSPDVLRRKCEPVQDGTDEARQLLVDLKDTLEDHGGAPVIGVRKRASCLASRQGRDPPIGTPKMPKASREWPDFDQPKPPCRDRATRTFERTLEGFDAVVVHPRPNRFISGVESPRRAQHRPRGHATGEYMSEQGPFDPPTMARRLVGRLADDAREATVVEVPIDLDHGAVKLADGRARVAYTFRDQGLGGCSDFHGLRPLCGLPAADLMALLESTVETRVGLACGNALANREEPAQRGGDILEHLDLGLGDDVAMAGHFGPLVEPLQQRARSLTICERVAAPTELLRPPTGGCRGSAPLRNRAHHRDAHHQSHGRWAARDSPSMPAGSARRRFNTARVRSVRSGRRDIGLERRRDFARRGFTRCIGGWRHAAVQPTHPQGHRRINRQGSTT